MERFLFDVSLTLAIVTSRILAAAFLVFCFSLVLKLVCLFSASVRFRFGHAVDVVLVSSLSIFVGGYLFALFGLLNSVMTLAILAIAITAIGLFSGILSIEETADDQTRSGGRWGWLRERFIHLPSMEPPLRLLTAMTVAQLIASALLLVLYRVPTHPLFLDSSREVYTEQWVFSLSVGFFVIAWAAVLVGASAGRKSFLVILVAFTGATLPLPLGSPDAVSMWTWSALSVWVFTFSGVWVWALITWRYRQELRERGLSTVPWRTTILNFAFLIALLGSSHLILERQLSRLSASAYPEFITEQIFRFSLCLVPVLLLTGRDCAEISEVAARLTLVTIPRRFFRAWTVLIAGSILYWSAMSFRIEASSFSQFQNYFKPSSLASVFVIPFVLVLILGYVRYRSAYRLIRVLAISLMVPLCLMVFVLGIVIIEAFAEYSLAIAALGLASVGALHLLIKTSAFQHWPSSRVPFPALLLVAVFLTGAHETATLWQATFSQVPTRGPVTSFEIFQCARPGARFFRDSSPECSLAYPSRWQPAFVPDFRTLIFRDVEPGSAQAEFRFPDFGSGSARPAFLVTVREMSELEGLLAGSDWTGLASRVWPFFGGESVGNDWSVELEVAPRPAWAGAEFMVYMDDKRQHVWVWVRRIGRLVWILGGYAPERHRAYYGNLYAAMVASWRPDRAASPPARLVYPDLKSTALRVSSFGLIPAILAPIGLILLFLPRARDVSRFGLLHRFLGGSGARLTGPTPFGTPRDFAGFFFVIVAITGFFFLPHGQLTELGGRTEAPAETIDAGTIDEAGGSSGAPTSQGINALQIFVSGITCLLVLIVTLRRTASVNSILLVELLQLNIALVFLSVFFWFYGKLAWASEKSVWIQAAVLIILKLWDFLTSGKDITNANGRLFQRRDLVFLYAGYLMLVATAILYFSAERSSANNRVIERFFDAESLLCQGIIWLGCPLLLFGFLSRVRRWYGFAERVT